MTMGRQNPTQRAEHLPQRRLLGLAQALALISVANGAPVLAKKLLGDRFARRLDGGLRLPDGQEVFGASKTVRGVALGVVMTAAAAPLVRVDAVTGAQIGAAAMVGDLLSSFTKRRLRLPPSSMAPGLDQVPEALLPLCVAAAPLRLSALDVVAGVALFWIGELAASRILYAINLRDRPY